MNVLVTGGLGFLGSLVIEKLRAAGFGVTVLDAEMYPRLAGPPGGDGVRLVRGDVRSQDAHAKTIAEADAVLHLAAIVGDEACNGNPERAVRINYLATRQIAMHCRDHGKPLVFTSTCSVYGAKETEIKEVDDVTPLSVYGMSKLAAEEAARGACPESVVLRLGTLFGYSPRMRFDLVINRLIGQAIQDGKITVFGGDQYRPFLHVQDAAEACLRILKRPKAGLYNLGGTNYRIKEVAQRIAEATGCDIVTYSEMRDRRTYLVNSDLARRRFDIDFGRNLNTAIGEIREAIDRREIVDYRDPSFSNAAWLSRTPT